MMNPLYNYPEYMEIGNKKYKINTDYRVAIRCNEISMQDIDPIEKGMAIIYLLLGDEALKDVNHYEEIAEKINYYLKCGDVRETSDNSREEPDFDFIQDYPYIVASFQSDYKIDIKEKKMHWWEFYYLLCGLSQSELGNSCVLNRIRDLRTMDLSKIKDPKTREKIKKAKEQFALKKTTHKKHEFTQEELDNMEAYHKLVGD